MSHDLAPRSLLVLGGARSGKSRYAQQRAEASGKNPVLIATAAAADAEMAERIAKHQGARGPRWRVVEEEIDVAGALMREAAEDRIVLVDCLTLWLSNLMMNGKDVDLAGEMLARSLSSLPGPVILVSNEVGLGIVPENALVRRFRDAQGWLNQGLAAHCEAVALIVAGLALQLKPGTSG
ncbi:MAG: bifunctional adenosylcobinamide kinase/adenosylcobinamide-phosphate guanylyltransferase [Methylovirgula sp.]|jgi:adenosylcobinamide kinase/adenosylcobinamide-phosphate guanylyltransferase